MIKLSDLQREKLMKIIKDIHNTEQKVWGLLPPSSRRDSARIQLFNAREHLEKLIMEDAEKEE